MTRACFPTPEKHQAVPTREISRHIKYQHKRPFAYNLLFIQLHKRHNQTNNTLKSRQQHFFHYILQSLLIYQHELPPQIQIDFHSLFFQDSNYAPGTLERAVEWLVDGYTGRHWIHDRRFFGKLPQLGIRNGRRFDRYRHRGISQEEEGFSTKGANNRVKMSGRSERNNKRRRRPRTTNLLKGDFIRGENNLSPLILIGWAKKRPLETDIIWDATTVRSSTWNKGARSMYIHWDT